MLEVVVALVVIVVTVLFHLCTHPRVGEEVWHEDSAGLYVGEYMGVGSDGRKWIRMPTQGAGYGDHYVGLVPGKDKIVTYSPLYQRKWIRTDHIPEQLRRS